ncbi:FAD:protein FMN transferase [Angustibacter sp. McL0619]|uniref:FAD:protein FMN transferase n=1 Tax=Angustibacter sp. McL0619 TaxID=3415676 RepID=UPI003CEB8A50
MASSRATNRATLTAWDDTGWIEVSDPAALGAARQIAQRHLDTLGRACHRESARAEVHRIPCAAGRPVDVSPLLARVVQASLEMAARTDGLVDPTVRVSRTTGQRSWIPVCGKVTGPAAGGGWRRVRLDGARLTVPAGGTLELRACALAVGLDDIALVAAQLTGADVLVHLGGRAATIGHGQATTDPRHVVDPRTGRPAPGTWSRIEVSAATCRTASGQAVAAAVLGERAEAWLARHHANARLTRPDGSVVQVGAFEPAALRTNVAA